MAPSPRTRRVRRAVAPSRGREERIRWWGDAAGRRTRFSRRWLDLTGRSRTQEAGHGWLDGLPDEDRRAYLGAIRAAAAGRRFLHISYRLRGADRQWHRIVEEALPRLGPRGRVAGFSGVCVEDAGHVDPVRAEAAPGPAEQRDISSRLELAREEERARLARELHDELGQVLTSIKLDMMWLCDQLKRPEARASLVLINKLQSLVGLIELMIATVQQVTTHLRPAVLDHFGLGPALEWEATKFQARTGIRCRVESRLNGTVLDEARATTLYRIAQESLTNVARHAHAGAVRLVLKKAGGRVILEIRDNGRGISDRELAHETATGLLGMQERARLLGGQFRVTGKPGRGTTVTVSIPHIQDP